MADFSKIGRNEENKVLTRINGRGEKIWVGTKEAYWARQRRLRRRIKLKVLAHYGGECACCGELEPDFLCINHINGGGNQHRKKDGGGVNFVRWLIKNDFPEGYNVLCFNCNFSTWYNGGVCAHAKE